tara:strand:+ start:827 stop:1687 length:861 start_codon:yes stop_codon:yes gene_type:complete
MKKFLLSVSLNYTLVLDIIFLVYKLFYKKKFIRAINYHSISEKNIENFKQQLKYYKKYYNNVSMDDLNRFLITGVWDNLKPGIILTFDDGLKNDYKIIKPLIEEYGFTGWFFIPAGFIDCIDNKQYDFAIKNNIIYKDHKKDNSTRLAMSWNEVKELSKEHIIACHTFSHHRMNEDDSYEVLENEIINSKRLIENKIGKDINVFGWVGGEEKHYTKNASMVIEKAGYRYSFMTNSFPIINKSYPFQLQRTNIEASNSLSVVKFQLCGLMDMFYTRKRRRVNTVTIN